MSSFAKVRITAPFALTMPTTGDLLTGSPNPMYGLITFINDSVAKKDRYGDGIGYVWNAEVLLEMFSPALLGVIVAQGADVEGLPLYFEIDLDANVPDAWKGSDENGDPVDRTWQQYYDATPNRTPITIGETVYASTALNGRQLKASEAVALGVTLITQPEIQALQAADE